jgi:5-formyltetrahydrofolate cyclo-ligase
MSTIVDRTSQSRREHGVQQQPDVAARKRDVRRRILSGRLDATRLASGTSGAAARLAAAATAHFSHRGWPTSVAAYLSIGSEPGTRPLIEAVAERGARVIVPVLRPDGDLDWARYTPGSEVASGSRGTLQPTSPSLGVDAVCAVDVAFVPALAVDHDGRRLGRGGGSYDRVLARLRGAGSTALVLAVVHDDEVLDEVPVDAHDQRVDGVLTPGGLALFHPHTPS